jgi:thiamine pyrophosphate-dependent acetolactate synthase large subunit-like protein
MFDDHDYIKDLNKAKRPVILAGYGVRAAHAVDEFRAFIERLNIPVLLHGRQSTCYQMTTHCIAAGRGA